MPADETPPRPEPPRKSTGVILRASYPRFKIEGNVVKIMPARLIQRDAESIDRAHDDITRGRPAYARHVLPALLKKYPLDFDIIEAQARLHELDESYEPAISMLVDHVDKFFSFLKDAVGKREGIIIPYNHKENRPFIGCLYKLGLYLWYKLKDELAIKYFKWLLNVDPTDPKGIRYFILHLAIELERYDEAAGLANAIRRDELQGLFAGGSNRLAFGLLYGLGLLVFLLGDLPGAMTLLEYAIKSNPHALANLLEDPRHDQRAVDHVVKRYGGTSSASEGHSYVDDWGDLWDRFPGSIEFLLLVANGMRKADTGASDEPPSSS